jgi:hypothetical protein
LPGQGHLGVSHCIRIREIAQRTKCIVNTKYFNQNLTTALCICGRLIEILALEEQQKWEKDVAADNVH